MVSALWLAAADAVEDGNADVVLRNGKIYTADKERSIKEAIAFKGNTIVAVGIDKDMAPLIGSATKVIDLGGRLVLLGLIDTHIHPIIGALNGAKCSLARVKATIDALKPSPRSKAVPTTGSRRRSSTITASRPQPKTSTRSKQRGRSPSGATTGIRSGSTVAALRCLGVTAETRDIPGGKIDRDAEGAPTGYFADRASIFVDEKTANGSTRQPDWWRSDGTRTGGGRSIFFIPIGSGSPSTWSRSRQG